MQKIIVYIFGIIPALISWLLAFLFLIPYWIDGDTYFKKISIAYVKLAHAFLNGDEYDSPSSGIVKKIVDGKRGVFKWRYYLCGIFHMIDPLSENDCIDSKDKKDK